MPRSLAARRPYAFSSRAPLAAGLLLALFCALFGFFAPAGSQVSAAGGSDSGSGGAQSARTLSFEERVRYQRALEEVYWRHTLWPKENSTQKPSLDEVAPMEVTRARVTDVLRQSDALARQ